MVDVTFKARQTTTFIPTFLTKLGEYIHISPTYVIVDDLKGKNNVFLFDNRLETINRLHATIYDEVAGWSW